MFRLQAFGGLSVVAEDGLIPGAFTQPRRLALLALLAVARDRGLSRDKVVAYLWPERDAAHAHHALNQLLHTQRKLFAPEDPCLGGKTLRLNPAVIHSDVGEFESALDRGDVEAAVRLWGGPFLDGFFLTDAPEFERWAEGQRGRLIRRLSAAYVNLANDAAAQAALDRSAQWWQRAAEINPLDSQIALHAVEALAAMGNRADAIRHAQRHGERLRNELGVAQDARLEALVARLRTTPQTVPGGVERAATPAVRAGARGTRPRVLISLGIALVVIVGALAYLRRARVPAALDPNVVAVLPFRVTGADPALGYLREGMVELLAVKLTGEGGPRAVDPGAVLSAWRRRGGTLTKDLDHDAALAVARHLGAGRLIEGSVVGTSGHVLVHASVIRVASGRRVELAGVEGSADSIASLVDLLTARVLAGEAGQSENLAGLTTNSLPALRAFLDGQAAYRSGSYRHAVQYLTRALQLDSSFALAGLELSSAASRCCSEQIKPGLRVAWAARDRLSARARALLTAEAGPGYPDSLSQRVEHLRTWELAVATIPDDADAWFGLGDQLLHWGPILGVPDTRNRANAAFRRALELDSSFAGPLQRLVEIAATSEDTATVRRLGTLYLARDSTSEIGGYLKWRMALALEDERALFRLREQFPQMNDQSLGEIIDIAQYDGVGTVDVERAVNALHHRASTRNQQETVFMTAWSAALNSGRPTDALEAQDAWRRAVTRVDPRIPQQLQVLDAIYWQGDTTAANKMALHLARSADAPLATGLADRSRQYGDVCVVSQWRLWHGQVGGVERAIALLRAATPPHGSSSDVRSTVNPAVCAAVLQAWLTTVRGASESPHALSVLDSLMALGPEPGLVIQYPNLVSARLHELQGDRRGALAAVRRRYYDAGPPVYLSTYLLEEGRLAALTGDRPGAVRAYRHYLALRPNPEPSATAEVDHVRAELASLTGERP